VHDYHFLAFGEEMRRMGVSNRMGFFLHIPFPAPEVLVALPSHAQMVRALFAYDLIGFQSEHDLGCFTNYVLQEAGGEQLADGRLSAFGTAVTAKVFPIGIDGRGFARFANSADAQRHNKRVRDLLAGRDQIIGVERLDYTKGIPERFTAFERLLEHYPENRGRVSLMQIAPPSRSEVRAYTEIRERLESMAGAINGRFADYDWTPIRYLNKGYNRRSLAGLYRASRVGLVTPLRDGMNLVAKEYVAAQDPDDPGVLVLSRFAGSAAHMSDALIVNPYDVQDVADAMQRGLNMNIGERRKRWQALWQDVRDNDVAKWTRDFLSELAASPR
jgi:trehalose 6-phosphate synthase